MSSVTIPPVNNRYDVIVIGGGASGMMAAIAAAEHGASVLLLEKNKRLGEKLRISGGGRCNILNAETDTRTLLSNYGEAAKFLHSAFATFGMQQTWDFFESIKLPLKVEAKNRAFPASEKAADVVHVLQNRLHRLGVDIKTRTEVTKIEISNDRISAVVCGETSYSTDVYIVATGGLSRPETGSTGDGFSWLRQLGHTIHTPTPNITPLALESSWKDYIAGKSIADCAATFIVQNKTIHKVRGSMVFTHFGVSGPVILNSSSSLEPFLQHQTVQVRFDILPSQSTEEVDKQLQKILNENGTKLLKNALPLLVPAGLAPAIKQELLTKVNFDVKCSEVNKSCRILLVKTVKALPAIATGLMGFDRAVIADGGVPLKEITMRTMRSTKCSNVYITGDLLHIQRPSGGYSLQLCWTTGYIAGVHAALTPKQ